MYDLLQLRTMCTCATFLFMFSFFPGAFFHPRVTVACPVTTDLIMQANVRTTPTTTVQYTVGWGGDKRYSPHYIGAPHCRVWH